MRSSRRSFLRDVAIVPFASALLAPARGSLSNPFFAMDTAMLLPSQKVLERTDVKSVADLHYKGISVGVTDAASWRQLTGMILPWLKASKLKLEAVYSWAHIGRNEFEIDPGIEQFGAGLRGWRSAIWLPVSSGEFKPSDPDGDDMAVQAVGAVAERARRFGCTVSLYPHFGNLMQSVSDAVRIAEKAQSENVGVTFNLCHWLKVDGAASMKSVLKLASPLLSFVTVNGADRDGSDWGQLIQPLDRGTFDVKDLLRELKALHYRGPIGLQGYDVASNSHLQPRENLARSMAAWRNLVASV